MSYIMETHLAELIYPRCNKLPPSGSHESGQTNTGNYLQILFGPGEVPTPELSSSSSRPHSDKRSKKKKKAGDLAQMIPLPDSSWSPLHSPRLILSHSCFSFHAQMLQMLDCLFMGIIHVYISSPPLTRHNSNDTAPPPEALQWKKRLILRLFFAFVFLTSHSRKEQLLKCTWF